MPTMLAARRSVGGSRLARQVVGRKEESPSLLYAVLGGSTRISLRGRLPGRPSASDGENVGQRFPRRKPYKDDTADYDPG